MNQNIPRPAPHVAAFERLGFGMFVHWGLYSILGQGEWAMHMQNIPKAEYAKLKDRFTAAEFDARALAALAKRAGMKYIVLTTRHHDGFSLYDTCGLNEYDAPHSPAGRDLVAEFVEGCRAEGIVPFFYHTTLDWYRDDYEADFPAYLRYLRSSVELLCTRYGPIGGLWFDGNWNKPDADWEEDALYGMIRSHQPHAIIVNNTGLQARGELGHPEIDSVTFEQGRPEAMDRRGHRKYVAAEMCQTINGHWGIGRSDFRCKSPGELIEFLCSCRKVGANYLLNIGPQADGGVDKLQAATLETVGDWVRLHGEALYDTTPAGIRGAGQDFALRGPDGRLYFFIHDLSIGGSSHVTVGTAGAGPRPFTGVQEPIRSLHWLDSGETLAFSQNRTADLFTFQATPYPYGTDLVVRIAVAETGD